MSARTLDRLEPDTVPLAEAAARLGIHRSTAYRLVQRGEFPIPVIRLGHRTVVAKAALERVLDGEEVA